ncbi:MAG: RNA pyrophosphohydrolase [Alphaproteobacteria bacterium]|nr:RNA pyrophosphohydrolase [Alphaproteobacteria bacterium]
MTKNQPPPQSKHQSNYDQAYRSSVGMVIFNHEGCVLLAERIGSIGSWQMPQGGIDDGEELEVAVFREMEEEIGTRNAQIIGMVDEWLCYDFPAHTAQKLFDGKYRGQRQKWIALRFLGQDSEINLEAHTEPEFSRWKWVPLSALMSYVVPFKRGVYERVMREFSQYAVKSAKD